MAISPLNYVVNHYENIPYVPQTCIEKLIKDNEMIWKLLYYTTPDAWKLPNITEAQKRAMIYTGQKDRQQDSFNVFIDTAPDDVWTKEATVLRIVLYEVIPDNTVCGSLLIGFEVYSHNQINTLNNLTTRVDTIIQQLIQTFNGQELQGFGTLYFDREVSRRLRAFESGLKPFKGKVLLMANNVL